MKLTRQCDFSLEISNARISEKEREMLFALQNIVLNDPTLRQYARGNPYGKHPLLKEIDEYYVQKASDAFRVLRDTIEEASYI